MAKILITTIQVNLGGGHTNSPELSLLKFLPLIYCCSDFLATTLIPHLFLPWHFGAAYFFHSLAVFL